MNKGLVKLALGVAVMALIAFVVASVVVKRDDTRQTATKQRSKGRGAIWQVPVAQAPMEDFSLGGLAG